MCGPILFARRRYGFPFKNDNNLYSLKTAKIDWGVVKGLKKADFKTKIESAKKGVFAQRTKCSHSEHEKEWKISRFGL